jgi:hypothetical protein
MQDIPHQLRITAPRQMTSTATSRLDRFSDPSLRGERQRIVNRYSRHDAWAVLDHPLMVAGARRLRHTRMMKISVLPGARRHQIGLLIRQIA